VSQGVANSESRFIFKDTVDYGKQSDGGTYSVSTLYHFSENCESTLPKHVSFQGSGTEMLFFIIGNEACPLKMSFHAKGFLI